MTDALVDVAVIGGGPAGSSISATLAAQGWRVRRFDARGAARPGLYETLTDESLRFLDRLGLRNAVESRIPTQPVRLSSAWSSAVFQIHATPIRLVERGLLANTLSSVADAAGADLVPSCVARVQRSGSHWELVTADGGTARARFIVDASGRNAVVARKLGESIHVSIRLAAVTARTRLVPPPSLQTDRLFILGEPAGWWYIAVTARGEVDVALYQDPLRIRRFGLAGKRVFAATLKPVFEQIRASGLDHARLSELVVRPAGQASLSNCAGNGWIAIGDAAAAFDPLTSQGLASAFSTAFFGACIVSQQLQQGSPDREAIATYAAAVTATHQRSAAMTAHQYRLGFQRFGTEFWAVRGGSLPQRARPNESSEPLQSAFQSSSML